MPATLTTKREILTVSADGICKNAEVSFGFVEDTMKWTAALPSYVVGLLNTDEWITGENLREVISTYEVYCDEYSRKILGAKAEPAIEAKISATTLVEGEGAGLDLEWRRVKMVDGLIYDENMRRLSQDSRSVILPDTPELWGKLNLLTKSIAKAGEILCGAHHSPDPAAYLLAISNDWQAPAVPATGQAELPFDSAVSSAEKHALSKPVAPIVPEDDDEL